MKGFLRLIGGLLATAGAVPQALPAQAAPPPVTATEQNIEAEAERIVARMTLDEKLPQLLNVAPAIPRLGIPAYNWWTESLHGALGPVATTNFPEPIALAASFDAPMVHAVAGAISTEVRALHTLGRQTGRLGRIGTGLDTWSPNINIFRDPRWGRGQETYGEDPFLTARLGVAFVTGMQGPDATHPDVIATPKHFAVHSGPESTRHMANVFVSAHDLEDTYLPAFRAAIVEGKAGSIMCAYNRIDGQPACASDLLLKDHLRGAWGFRGYIVSDCDAVKDIADNHHYAPDQAAAVAVAVKAGVDNECNTATLSDTAGIDRRFREAIDRGLLSLAEVDRALVRLFAARLRNGDLPALGGDKARIVPVDQIGTAAHQALARDAAAEAMVLLKNDGILPLKPGIRLAVIGPLGDATRVLRGNYSSPLSAPPVSVVEGLRHALPRAQVSLVPFSPSLTDGDRVPSTALVAPDGRAGVEVRYYNPASPIPALIEPAAMAKTLAAIRYQERTAVTRLEPDVGDRNLELAKVATHHRTEWRGFLVPPESGTYRVGLSGTGGVLTLDGRLMSDRSKAAYNDLPSFTTIDLVAGRRYAFHITSSGGADLVWKRVSNQADADLAAAAANADALVAVVGLTSDLEAEETGVKVPGFEGGDKTTLDLPADQVAMLERARATGKPLIVVAMNGSPINLGWAKDHAAAILEAWYPGQAGGTAVADVMTGKVNPSGRLPLTFYSSVADLPPFGDYTMAGRTYRYFAGKPVYPFGYGLSYTRFAYAPLTIGGSGAQRTVSTTVANTGDRTGAEAVQLYLNFPNRPGTPNVALRGFQRVTLAPGERREVTFELSPRDLSTVTSDGRREVAAGRYRVSVGGGQPGTSAPGRSAELTIDQPVAIPL